MLAYIPDGYTARGYIAEVPRLHPALHFSYRPAGLEEGSDHLEKGGRLKAAEADRASAAWLDRKILDWDLRHPHTGEAVAKDVGGLRRLNRRLFNRLLAIVLGVDPSDEDPEAPVPDADAGLLTNELRERDAKNS